MSPLLRAHFFLFIVALIYGLNYIVAKEIMPHYMQPMGFIFTRISLACVLFWLLNAAIGKHEKIDRRDFPRLIACGLFGAALNMSFFFIGLNLTSPINASIIMTTNPILVLISSYFILNEKLTVNKWIGIGLGMLGALSLILLSVNTTAVSGNGVGDSLVFLNAMSYGIYLVLVKPLMKKYEGLTVIKWVFLFGLLFVTPFGVFEFAETSFASFTPSIWGAIAFVVIGTTFFTYLLNILALKTVNPSVVSVYIYLQPLLASIAAISLGKDQIDAIKIVAMAFIFSGVYLVSKSKKKLAK